MLGSNIREVGWPTCGEIDIMEHVGFDPGRIHANIHTKAYNHVQGWGGQKGIDDSAFPTRFVIDYVRIYRIG